MPSYDFYVRFCKTFFKTPDLSLLPLYCISNSLAFYVRLWPIIATCKLLNSVFSDVQVADLYLLSQSDSLDLLKRLSQEIAFKNFDKNLQNLA